MSTQQRSGVQTGVATVKGKITSGTQESLKYCPTCGEHFPVDYAVCPRDTTPLLRSGVSDDPLVGEILGDTYEVMQKLGEGGMGRVYEARHIRLGRSFAVKILHAQFSRDRDAIARFRREATAVAAVDSPHVAQVVDVNTTKTGQPYIVIELLQGEDLGRVLHRQGRLTISRAVSLARQVCRGLHAAHAAGVVHRDLKPENVMLIRRNDVELAVILDFGIAKSLTADNSLTQTGTVLGTPAYMAPEQARGSTQIDHRADIYAVGAMLYRALTGQAAFGSDNPTTTLTQVLHEEPPRPKTLRTDLPDALELIIQRAMAKKPADRYASMAELEQALAPFETKELEPLVFPSSVSPLESSAAPRRDLGRADTVALGPSSSSSTLSGEAKRARFARMRVATISALAVLWSSFAIACLTSLVIFAVTNEPLELLGTVLSAAVAGAVVIPSIVVWVRYLYRGAWRNSHIMAKKAEILSKLLTSSLSAFALTIGIWRSIQLLVYRKTAIDSRMELCAWTAAIVTGLLFWGIERWNASRQSE